MAEAHADTQDDPPQCEVKFIAAAFPERRAARTQSGDDGDDAARLEGRDDRGRLAWMKFGTEASCTASPRAGSSVVARTGVRTNPNAIDMISKNTIFTKSSPKR